MIVIDSSFLVKLVLDEPGSEKARRLVREWIASGEQLATLDMALIEALNALWKRTIKLGDLDRAEALSAAEDILKVWRALRTYPSVEVATDAFETAIEVGLTVYDSLYLQLALSKGGKLATFDKKLSKKALELGLLVYH